jgi:hypothetical protein
MGIYLVATSFRKDFLFSAFLRQDSSAPDSKNCDWVEEILDLLNLHDM